MRRFSGPRKIAVFRALQLGDVLCAVPALRALRAANPGALITLIGLPWADEFVARFSKYIDAFMGFPGYPGLPEQSHDSSAFREFLAAANAKRFDLAIQMHGNGRITNQLVSRFGARVHAGYCWRQKVANRWFMEYPDGISEIDRHLALMRHLGIDTRGRQLEMPVHVGERDEYRRLADRLKLKPKTYVCVHAGGRSGTRRWDAHCFSRVADYAAELGYRIILTGTDGEKRIVEDVARAMEHPAISLAGKTSLGGLAMLVGNAALLLANDTGVSHVAAATATPSVIVFTGSDPMRWAPLNRGLHKVVAPAGADGTQDVIRMVETALRAQKLAKAL